MSKLLLDAPNLGTQEKRLLSKAVDDGFVSTCGPFVPRFERLFAARLKSSGVVATQSGTAAIHMALYEAGVGRGDEVIVPILTFAATVNPVMYVGARPVFADIDPKTWNINPESIERLITKRTKAIIPVHLYGNPCAMDAIMAIAKRRSITVIEDAAESLGATLEGKETGTIGDYGCFSFNGNKIITTGGGGMIVSKDRKKMEHIRFLVNQARDSSEGYYHPEIGFNYRMTNVEAALGLAQLARLNEFLKKKRAFRKIYRDELQGTGSVRFQEEEEGAAGSWWLTALTLDRGIDVERLQKSLASCGIPTCRVFMPVVDFPPYRRFRRCNRSVARRLFERGLCLPCSTKNSYDAIRRAAEMLRRMLEV